MHSFALTKNSTLFFSINSALFGQNRGVACPASLPTMDHHHYAALFSSSALSTFTPFRQPAPPVPTLSGRFSGSPVTSHQSLAGRIGAEAFQGVSSCLKLAK